MKTVDTKEIASKFNLDGDVKDVVPLSGGLINSSYIVTTTNGTRYVLQKKNGNIFKDVPGMMENIVNVTDHIRRKVKERGGDEKREVMTVILNKDGKPYYKDENGDCWATTLFIEDSMTIEKADTPELAYKGGEGIGSFHLQLADFTKPLHDVLPGFHNLRFRFDQWDKSVKENKSGRADKVRAEIDWIEQRRKKMLDFWEIVEKGVIPKRVTHNDTKISNILFDKDGKVLSVIDLDTVLSNTVLADYGDAIRTFANTVPEDYPDADKAELKIDIFKAYTDGYLSKTAEMLNEAELEYLAFGAHYITFEQALRFLMDYIDGDTYYHTDYPEHNLVRTHVQQKLLESMEKNDELMKNHIKNNKK